MKRFNHVIYHHMRSTDESGKAVPNGGVTIAIKIPESGNIISAGFARCHVNDPFCKRTGRVKAMGRLQSKSPALEQFRFSIVAKNIEGMELKEVIDIARMITLSKIQDQFLTSMNTETV